MFQVHLSVPQTIVRQRRWRPWGANRAPWRSFVLSWFFIYIWSINIDTYMPYMLVRIFEWKQVSVQSFFLDGGWCQGLGAASWVWVLRRGGCWRSFSLHAWPMLRNCVPSTKSPLTHTHWNMSTPFRHPHSPRFRALPVARTHPKRHSKQKTCQNPEIRQNFITRCEAQRNSYGRRYFVSETRIWLPIRNHCVLFEHQNAQRLLGCWNKHGEDWHRAVGYTIAH